MRFSVLIIILHFVILAVALVDGMFSLGQTCHKCPKVVIDAQFLDVVCYGLLLLIFFVCVSIMARESIPPKMQLTISFSAAILYFMAGLLLVHIFVSDGKFVVAEMTCSIVLGVLHLTVGLLHVFRNKLSKLT